MKFGKSFLPLSEINIILIQHETIFFFSFDSYVK